MFDFASDGRSEGDHLGRNDKGLVTYDRKTRKDAFYFYKANWSDAPVVHITSQRFNPRPAGPLQVKVYSNCDSLELFVDGESIGTQNGRDGVYLWGTNLPPGKHKFRAVGQKGPKTYKDQVVWELQR
jgi:beta-galactosidase